MDEAQKALQFVSISSDGDINLWTMNKSELTHEKLMKLKVSVACVAWGFPSHECAVGAALVIPRQTLFLTPLTLRQVVKVGLKGQKGDESEPVEDEGASASTAGGTCMDFSKVRALL